MSDETAMAEVDSSIMAKIVLEGDLSSLAPDERLQYYTGLCRSLKLNPLTKPFDYLQLNGKLILYANKDCAQQLVRNHRLSLQILSQGRLDGDIYMVTVRATNGTQTVDAVGVVNVYNLRGDQLANTIMKCSTKASRRATLSIVGLGILDETEVETIPNAAVVDVDYSTGEIQTTPSITAGKAGPVVLAPNSDIADVPEDTHPLLLTCPTHDVPWEQKAGRYGEFKSHKDGSKWCNFNKVMKGLLADLAKATDRKLPVLSKLSDEEVVALHDAWQTAPVAEEVVEDVIVEDEVATAEVVVEPEPEPAPEPEPEPEPEAVEAQIIQEETPEAAVELDGDSFEDHKLRFMAWLDEHGRGPAHVRAVLRHTTADREVTVTKWMEEQQELVWAETLTQTEKWNKLRELCLTSWAG